MAPLRTVTMLVVLLCIATHASAQTPVPALASHPVLNIVALPDGLSAGERLSAIQRWTREFTDWRGWFEKWRNRPEPGWLSSRDRRAAPEPPAWLPAMCSGLLQDSGPVADACGLWDEWIRDGHVIGLLDAQQAVLRAAKEASTHSVWWEHVHLDALWPLTEVGSSAFGLCGVHVTMQLTRRVGVFLTPGAILMRVPSPTGGSAWSPATDWGFSYRMFDLRLPGMRRRSSAHFNMARVWLLGNATQPFHGATYLAGFSLTFKRR